MSQHNLVSALPRTPYPQTASTEGDYLYRPPPQPQTSRQQAYRAPVDINYEDWLDVSRHPASDLQKLASAAIASSGNADAQWTAVSPHRPSEGAKAEQASVSPTTLGSDCPSDCSHLSESTASEALGAVESDPQSTAHPIGVPEVAMAQTFTCTDAPREVHIEHGKIAFASEIRGTVRPRSIEGESDLAARRKRPRLEP
ncbi:hypothetical protein LTR95_017613, partial [Oleoguttula sp. CCFEE 5521]